MLACSVVQAQVLFFLILSHCLPLAIQGYRLYNHMEVSTVAFWPSFKKSFLVCYPVQFFLVTFIFNLDLIITFIKGCVAFFSF